MAERVIAEKFSKIWNHNTSWKQFSQIYATNSKLPPNKPFVS